MVSSSRQRDRHHLPRGNRGAPSIQVQRRIRHTNKIEGGCGLGEEELQPHLRGTLLDGGSRSVGTGSLRERADADLLREGGRRTCFLEIRI
jgi:hypothetical protein